MGVAKTVEGALDERWRLAFDLFSASFFQPSADGRLLMLMMAVETLLELRPRSEAAQNLVEQLIATTKASQITESERRSLSESLSWLMNESIGQAGRELASRLEPRTYMDLRPKKFFTQCYKLRSDLVHGKHPRPDRDRTDLHAAALELFVGDVLSGPLLDRVSD